MRYLLDTHIFLWWLEDNKNLKEKTKEIIKDPKNQIFISIASAWEMSIKSHIGKLTLKTSIENCFESSSFLTLDIVLSHISQLESLPKYHNDPFDRMLIAQSLTENLIFITDDSKIRKYNLKIA